MKYIFFVIGSLIATAFVSCSQNCSNETIALIGRWDVKTVEFIDEEGKMKELIEADGQDYETFVQSTKVYELIEFNFKEDGVLEVIDPNVSGDAGETPYTYKQGEDHLMFGGREYGFEVKSCDEITLIDFALDKSVQLNMHCQRIGE